MRRQVGAIAWAQWRTTRNHLPRTGTGTWLMAVLGFLYYGIFAVIAFSIFRLCSVADLPWLRLWLPAGTLAVCAFWQIVPLLTLTGGWSLDLKKLQSFPLPTGTLFALETLLRVTTAGEMLLVVTGACAGLAVNPAVAKPAFLFLILVVPFNLLLSLGIREFILHSFAHNRLREIFAVLMISLALLPPFLVRSAVGPGAKPYLLNIARAAFLPWSEIAGLSTGPISFSSILGVLLWIAASYAFARTMFVRGLRQDAVPAYSAGPHAGKRSSRKFSGRVMELPGRLFPDPIGILIEKEVRSLLRMPRFRVIAGMACLFSIVVFLPLSQANASFVRNNFPEVVALYGMLLLSEVLFWNIFGFDRSAVQMYFVAPVDIRRVIQAKNLTAVIFVAIQNLIVLAIAGGMHYVRSPLSILSALSCTAVVTIFFLSAGNISSVTTARPVDPTQTLKKQTNAQRQLWFLGCMIGMALLLGLGLVARWAAGSDWALIAVLAVEFGLGVIVFRVCLDAAAEGARARTEQLVAALEGRSTAVSGQELVQLQL